MRLTVLLIPLLLASCARDTPRRRGDAAVAEAGVVDAGADGPADARPDRAADLPGPPELGADGPVVSPDSAVVDRGADLPSYIDGSAQSVTTAPARCSPDGWCWAHPRPHGLTLNAVWAHSGSAIFAVGNAGVVQRYDGTSWVVASTVTPENLRACWGSSADVLWVAGDGGIVLRYDVKTKQVVSWQLGAVDLRAIWGRSASDLWVVGDQGFAAHFDGQGWQTVQLPTFNTLRALAGTASAVYAVGDAGTLLVGGAQGWKKLAADAGVDFISVYAEGQNALALGNGGRVFSVSAGSVSEVPGAPSGVFVRAMAGLAGTVYLLAYDFSIQSSRLFRRDSSGWSALSAGPANGLYGALWPLPSGGLALVGALGATARYDAGSGVQPLNVGLAPGWSPYGMTLTNLGPLLVGRQPDGSGFAATLTSTGWRVEPKPPTLVYDVWSAGGVGIFAVGDGVHRFDGAGWIDADGAYSGKLAGIWGFQGGELIVVGNDVIRRRDASGTWSDESPTPGSTPRRFSAVWGSDPQHLFAVGSTGTKYTNLAYGYTASAGWVDLSHPGGTNLLTAVWGSSPTDVYAGGQSGLWRFDGASWSQVSLPGASGTPKIFSIWGRSSSDIYVVADKGRVFHKTAVGWVAEDSGVDVNLAEVHGAATGSTFIATSAGGMLAHP